MKTDGRRIMANSIETIINVLDKNTGMFKECTSLRLELTCKDKFIFEIPFLRTETEALVRDDVKATVLPSLYETKKGQLVQYNEWKQYSTRLALSMKDGSLIGDRQYHVIKMYLVKLLKSQSNMPGRSFIPSLKSVINLRTSMDATTILLLGLRAVQGLPVAVLVSGGHGVKKELYKYLRSNDIIGFEFDIIKMIKYGLTLFWDIFPKDPETGKKLFYLRATVDGAKLTDLNQFCTMSLRFLIPNLIPQMAELLLKSVKCEENRENMSTFFRIPFSQLEYINDNGLLHTAPGETEPSLLPLRIILCPDAKMSNCLCGIQNHTAEFFCPQCKISKKKFLEDPLRNSNLDGGPQEPFFPDPIWKNIKNVANCTLHFFLRFCDCFLGETLTLCNNNVKFKKEIHAKHFNDFCGVSIVFYGETNAVGQDKKTSSSWSSQNGPAWRKILYKFDLSTVYDGDDLFLAHILWALFALVTFGMERRKGTIGFLTGGQIRVLTFLLVDVFQTLYSKNPTARYVI